MYLIFLSIFFSKCLRFATKAMRRMVAIIKMAPNIDPKSWDHKDEAKYGLGLARSVEDFYRIFGMDVHRKKVRACVVSRGGRRVVRRRRRFSWYQLLFMHWHFSIYSTANALHLCSLTH